MTELFDAASVRDEPEHWDVLAERVAAHAARESKRSGFEWLAHSRVGWVAACLVLAVTLLSTLSQNDSASPGSSSTEWTEVLAPADDVGRAIVSPDGPPPMGALILGSRGGA